MLLNILLSILVVICVCLTLVILMQRSEGGALGMGGGAGSMFTARGAGDLLSRTTAILAFCFFALSLAITLLAGHVKSSSSVTERVKVNPIDLNALAHQQPAQGGAAAASSSEAAPPLPNTAPPPLPNTSAPIPGAPAQAGLRPAAPRPTARRGAQARGPVDVSGVQVQTPSQSAPPPLPRPDINAPASQ